MRVFQKQFIRTFGLMSLIVSASVYAVNGAYDYGFSEITRGMGGAGSALPQDSLIAAINPAGMVDVGKRFDLGAMIYFPTISYTATPATPTAPGSIGVAPGYHDSSVPLFFLPDFGINLPINQRSAFGVSSYSLGGFGAEFKTTNTATIVPAPAGASQQLQGPLGNGTLLSSLKQSLTALTYSHQFLKDSSWGVSLLLGLQAFENQGIANLSNLSAHPNQLSHQGTDYSAGIGARFGVLFRVLPKIDFAASYQPKVAMTKLTEYAGLFPNGGEFDYPAFGNIGLAWHVTNRVALAGDVEKIWFTDVSNYGASHDALLNGTCTANQSTCLGGTNGAGFGWSNDIVYKLGVQFAMTENTTLRGGWSHGNQVLSNQYATENMITPGALITNVYSVGATQQISKKDLFNGVISFIPQQRLTSQNLFSGAANQTVTLAARGIGFGLSWSRILD